MKQHSSSKKGYDGFDVELKFGGATLGLPASTDDNDALNIVTMRDLWNPEYPDVYDLGWEAL